MADRFVDYDESTPVCASWLNQVDRSVFTALGSSDTPAQLRTFLGVLGEAPIDGNKYARQNGGWAVVEIAGVPTGDSVLLAPTTAAYNTITLSNASYNALRLKAASGQTANILEVQDNSGTKIAAITNIGSFYAGAGYDSGDSTPDPTAGVTAQGYSYAVGPAQRGASGPNTGIMRVAPSGSTPGVVVKADASGTGDLLRFENSSATRMSFVDSEGSIYAGNDVNPGQVKLAGGTQSRVNVTKYTTNNTQMLLCEAAYAGNVRELRYHDSLLGSTYLNGEESTLIMRRKYATGGDNLDLGLVQLRSFTGTSAASGKVVLAHGLLTGSGIGYWHIQSGENGGPYALYISHSSSANDSGTMMLKVTSDGDVYAARDIYANGVKIN